MILFGFNESIPVIECKHTIKKCLSDTLREYKKVSDQHGKDVDGIVTPKLPSKIKLNNELSLFDVISGLDREEKKYAFSLFRKYPFETFFRVKNEDIDGLVEDDWTIEVANEEIEAFNLNLIHDYGGIAFTLAIDDGLKRNELIITNTEDVEKNIKNLFGDSENTNYIKNECDKIITSSLGNFEKFKRLIGDPVCHKQFEKDFSKASLAIQDALIDLVEKADQRKGTSKLFSDGNLIKTVQYGTKRRIQELRMFEPAPMRMYFLEDGENVYLAKFKSKPEEKVQDQDIESSTELIENMMKKQNS